MAWCRQQQTITWANADPDLCRNMTALDHNELKRQGLNKMELNL